MSLSHRVSAGLLVLVGLLAALELARQAQLGRVYGQARSLATVHLEASRAALRVRGHLAAIDNLARKFVLLDADSGYAGELTRLRRKIAEEIDGLARLELTADEAVAATALDDAWRTYAAAAVTAQDRALAGDTTDLAARLVAPLDELERHVGALETASREATRSRVAAARAEVEGARRTAWLVGLAGVAAALVVAVAVGRAIGGPVERLAAATHRVAGGDFEVRVPVEGTAEVASLAADFNRMIDRLGELDQLKRGFVSAVSHDLKAPLASIHETIRLLLDEVGGELTAAQREMLELSLESNDRLSAMIGDLLDLARLDAGAMPFGREPLRLDAVAGAAVDEARTLEPEGGARLVLDPKALELPVLADREAILQALRNLLSNAMAFAPEGPIEVLTGVAAGRDELAARFSRPPAEAAVPAAWIEVADRGPGVADADREAIFEPFRQALRSKRGRRGTGLGLAIARGIATGHGGSLWVEERAGGGSRFVLLLPTTTPAERREAAA